MGPKYLLWLLINETVFRCACGHGDMRTSPHKVLAATLTLFQPGGDRLYPPYADVHSPHQVLKATGAQYINNIRSFDSTGFASNSEKIWGGKRPFAPMVPSTLNIPHTKN